MAKLNITEYRDVRETPVGYSQAPLEPAIAYQTLTFSTTTQSLAFNSLVRVIRVISDVNCYISIGEDPAATTSRTFLEAGEAELFGVHPGHKISAYDGVS